MSFYSIPVETLATVTFFMRTRTILRLRMCNRKCLEAIELVGMTPEKCKTMIFQESTYLFDSLEKIVLSNSGDGLLTNLEGKMYEMCHGIVKFYSVFEKEYSTVNGGNPLSSLRIKEKFNNAWNEFNPHNDNLVKVFLSADFFVDHEFDQVVSEEDDGGYSIGGSDDQIFDSITTEEFTDGDACEYHWIVEVNSTFGFNANRVRNAMDKLTIANIEEEACKFIEDYVGEVDK